MAGGEAYREDGAASRLLLAGDCDAVVSRIVKDAGLADGLRKILPQRHESYI